MLGKTDTEKQLLWNQSWKIVKTNKYGKVTSNEIKEKKKKTHYLSTHVLVSLQKKNLIFSYCDCFNLITFTDLKFSIDNYNVVWCHRCFFSNGRSKVYYLVKNQHLVKKKKTILINCHSKICILYHQYSWHNTYIKSFVINNFGHWKSNKRIIVFLLFQLLL